MTAITTPSADPGDPIRPRREVRSYVLRRGRLGGGQQRALAALGPAFLLPFGSTPIDRQAVFGRRAPLVVEIGFGMGQATAQIAAATPATDFLGIEVHEAGVGALLREIGDRGLGNIRIVRHDAVEVLRQMIAPASLAAIHVFFPDPWPKKRHHKRRLIRGEIVDLMASRLSAGGHLHCATDWADYAAQMLTELTACPALVNTASDYAPRPESRPLTKFEARGLKLGHPVRDLVFMRR